MRKKIGRILLILLAITIWCNIGYYFGENRYEAGQRIIRGEALTTFQEFRGGGWRCFEKNYGEDDNYILIMIFSIILWPLELLVVLISWILYGVALVAVFLFKFIFMGGFFALIVKGWKFLVSLVVLVVVVILYYHLACSYKIE